VQLESRERPTITRSYAILNYGSKPTTPIYPPPTQPFLLPNTSTSFLEYALSPLKKCDIDDFPSASEVTRRVTINLHQHVMPGQGGKTIWLQNGFSWTPEVPEEPYLVSLYKNNSVEFPSLERAGISGIDNETGAFPAKIGEVLEIVLQNTGADSGGVDVHPWQ